MAVRVQQLLWKTGTPEMSPELVVKRRFVDGNAMAVAIQRVCQIPSDQTVGLGHVSIRDAMTAGQPCRRTACLPIRGSTQNRVSFANCQYAIFGQGLRL